MKLNLGCGPYRAPVGWLNIDHPSAEFDEDVVADIYSDIRDLPFRDSVAESIYLGHVLEHIEPDRVEDVLLELYRVTAPDGVLMVVGPCMDKIDALDNPEPWLLEAMKVDNKGREGVHHRWIPTATKTLEYLENTGWLAEEVELATLKDSGWPLVAYTSWQSAVEARP